MLSICTFRVFSKKGQCLLLHPAGFWLSETGRQGQSCQANEHRLTQGPQDAEEVVSRKLSQPSFPGALRAAPGTRPESSTRPLTTATEAGPRPRPRPRTSQPADLEPGPHLSDITALPGHLDPKPPLQVGRLLGQLPVTVGLHKYQEHGMAWPRWLESSSQ